MPNWCSSTVTITAPPREIKALSSAITKIQETPRVKTDFGETWLGHFLDHLGEWDREEKKGLASAAAL